MKENIILFQKYCYGDTYKITFILKRTSFNQIILKYILYERRGDGNISSYYQVKELDTLKVFNIIYKKHSRQMSYTVEEIQKYCIEAINKQLNKTENKYDISF